MGLAPRGVDETADEAEDTVEVGLLITEATVEKVDAAAELVTATLDEAEPVEVPMRRY